MANKRQESTIARVAKVDPTASTEEVEGLILISYTPRWERGRMANGSFRENPNPQRVTHAITEDGKLHGWGFGPVKVKLPEGVSLTTKEDMAEALKQRAEARKPAKPEVEATEEATPEPEEPKAEATRKPATKKSTTTRKRTTGVQVSK